MFENARMYTRVAKQSAQEKYKVKYNAAIHEQLEIHILAKPIENKGKESNHTNGKENHK